MFPLENSLIPFKYPPMKTRYRHSKFHAVFFVCLKRLFFVSRGKEHTPVARQSKAGFNLYLKILIAVISSEE